MLTKSNSWLVLIYGLALIGLGYWGYASAGSLISSYMGAACGVLLAISAILMFKGKKSGAYIAIFVTLILTATFGIRYSLTHKQLPAIMAVLSGGMLLFLLAKSAKWKK